MHFLSYLCCRLVGVAQFYFDTGYEGTIYPVLGGSAAGLPHHSAQVALGEALAAGIVAYLVMLCAVLGDELDKAVEDSLLA